MSKSVLLLSAFLALSSSVAKAEEGVRAGDPVITEGLVCDTASEAEAVATLAHHGYTQEAALDAVNGEMQRCVLGIPSLGRYVREVSIFSLGAKHVAVQEVEILAIAPLGKAMRLPRPLRQFMVSFKKLKGA